LKYNRVSPIYQGRVVASNTDTAAILGLDGRTYFELRCNHLTDLQEGIAIVGHKGEHSNRFVYRYVDSIGKPIHKGVFKDARPFLNGVAQVQKGDDTYMIDKKGNRVMFEDSLFLASYYDSGYAFIKNQLGEIGLIDDMGNVVAAPSIVKIKKRWIVLSKLPNHGYKRSPYSSFREVAVPKIENGHFYEKKFHTWVEADLPK